MEYVFVIVECNGVGGKAVWAHFSNPPAFAGRDYTIITELRRLIDSTPAGATIRGTIHSISIDGVADSLLAAQNRGVSVSVVLDGKNATSTDPAVATISNVPGSQGLAAFVGGGMLRHAWDSVRPGRLCDAIALSADAAPPPGLNP